MGPLGEGSRGWDFLDSSIRDWMEWDFLFYNVRLPGLVSMGWDFLH